MTAKVEEMQGSIYNPLNIWINAFKIACVCILFNNSVFCILRKLVSNQKRESFNRVLQRAMTDLTRYRRSKFVGRGEISACTSHENRFLSDSDLVC